jgi:hypothetical protein
MYCWNECLLLSCPVTNYSDVLTIVAGIRFLATITFLYCCTFEHAYRAIAWQLFGQIRYNMLCLSHTVKGKKLSLGLTY